MREPRECEARRKRKGWKETESDSAGDTHREIATGKHQDEDRQRTRESQRDRQKTAR